MRIKTIIRKQREYKRMGLAIKELQNLLGHIHKFKHGDTDSLLVDGAKCDARNCIDEKIVELRERRDEMEV